MELFSLIYQKPNFKRPAKSLGCDISHYNFPLLNNYSLSISYLRHGIRTNTTLYIHSPSPVETVVFQCVTMIVSSVHQCPYCQGFFLYAPTACAGYSKIKSLYLSFKAKKEVIQIYTYRGR